MMELGWDILGMMAAIAVLAGIVKGVVGFAMPMVMISSLAMLVPPDVALAALIVPTLTTNIWQAFRNGIGPALQSARAHWVYLTVTLVFIAGSAQLVNMLPKATLFLFLGLLVTGFALFQLLGWRLRFPPGAKRLVEVLIGAFAGFVGGLSGVWGPPTVAYLTALETEKTEQMRVQGVVYGMGAVVLMAAHLRSGVLNADTLPLSALMLVPAVLGMAIGFRIHDRVDQTLFRKATLLVLILAGLNLIRRAYLA